MKRPSFRTVKQESPLVVGRAPFIRAPQTIASRMWLLNLALVPVILASVAGFGARPLWILLHTAASALLFELVAEKMFARPIRVWDGSVLAIGLILGLMVPPDTPWWMCWIASFFAVFVARELAGGLGRNRFHPALFGLAVLYVLYPLFLAHPVVFMEQGIYKAAILIGAIFLIFKRLIHWQNSFVYLGSVFLAAWVLGHNPVSELMSGAVLFAAVFLTTDSVTSSLTIRGQVIFASCAGILTAILSVFVGYPENVVFAILIMNGGLGAEHHFKKYVRF